MKHKFVHNQHMNLFLRVSCGIDVLRVFLTSSTVTDPVQNISVHPLWYAYVPGDLITAVADGNPPPRFTWAVLSVVDVSGVSTNSTNSTNSSNSANSANSTNSTTAVGSRWNSSELTVTPDMIGSNWTVVVTAYNNIFGVESSLEVVVNFTVIAGEILSIAVRRIFAFLSCLVLSCLVFSHCRINSIKYFAFQLHQFLGVSTSPSTVLFVSTPRSTLCFNSTRYSVFQLHQVRCV